MYDAKWQTPNGSIVPTAPLGFKQANGSELYQIAIVGGPALIRGPDYNSTEGEYCCVKTAVPDQRRCVTLSECKRSLDYLFCLMPSSMELK